MDLSWHEQLNMVGSAIRQIIRPNHSGLAPRGSTVSELYQLVRVQRFNASAPIKPRTGCEMRRTKSGITNTTPQLTVNNQLVHIKA